jgi:hypothetical protein
MEEHRYLPPRPGGPLYRRARHAQSRDPRQREQEHPLRPLRENIDPKRLEALPTATSLDGISWLREFIVEDYFRTNPCLRYGRPLKSFKEETWPA